MRKYLKYSSLNENITIYIYISEYLYSTFVHSTSPLTANISIQHLQCYTNVSHPVYQKLKCTSKLMHPILFNIFDSHCSITGFNAVIFRNSRKLLFVKLVTYCYLTFVRKFYILNYNYPKTPKYIIGFKTITFKTPFLEFRIYVG